MNEFIQSLHNNIINEDVQGARVVINKFSANTNKQPLKLLQIPNSNGLLPFTQAIISGNLEMVKMLKIYLPNAELSVVDGPMAMNALHTAVVYGRLDILRYFNNTLNINLDETTLSGDNLLRTACSHNQAVIFRFLVDHCKFDVNHRGNDPDSPLELAIRLDHNEILQTCFDEKSITFQTLQKAHSLHLAASNNSLKCLCFLASLYQAQHVSIDVLNGENKTALSCAIDKRKDAAALCLIGEFGAAIDVPSHFNDEMLKCVFSSKVLNLGCHQPSQLKILAEMLRRSDCKTESVILTQGACSEVWSALQQNCSLTSLAITTTERVTDEFFQFLQVHPTITSIRVPVLSTSQQHMLLEVMKSRQHQITQFAMHNCQLDDSLMNMIVRLLSPEYLLKRLDLSGCTLNRAEQAAALLYGIFNQKSAAASWEVVLHKIGLNQWAQEILLLWSRMIRWRPLPMILDLRQNDIDVRMNHPLLASIVDATAEEIKAVANDKTLEKKLIASRIAQLPVQLRLEEKIDKCTTLIR